MFKRLSVYRLHSQLRQFIENSLLLRPFPPIQFSFAFQKLRRFARTSTPSASVVLPTPAAASAWSASACSTWDWKTSGRRPCSPGTQRGWHHEARRADTKIFFAYLTQGEKQSMTRSRAKTVVAWDHKSFWVSRASILPFKTSSWIIASDAWLWRFDRKIGKRDAVRNSGETWVMGIRFLSHATPSYVAKVWPNICGQFLSLDFSPKSFFQR